MSWVAAAVTTSAVVNYFSQQQAANTQANALNNSTAMQQGMFNTIEAQNKPFVNSGTAALSALMYGEGLGGGSQGNSGVSSGGFTPGADFVSSPGNSGVTSGQFTQGFTPADLTANLSPAYNFQQQQGQQGVTNGDTPGQGALSGGTLKDLTTFNQNLASTSYQNAFNNWNTTQNNIFSRLSGIAGLGQASANNTAAAGTTLGTGMAQSNAAAGAATAGGIVGGANALSGAAVPLAYMMNNGATPTSSNIYNPGSSTTDYFSGASL